MTPGQPAVLQHSSQLQTHPDMAAARCQVPPAPAQFAAEALGWVNEPSLDANIFPPPAGGLGGLCQAVKWSWHCTVHWSLFGSCVPYALLTTTFTGCLPAKSDGSCEEQSIAGSKAAMG